MNYLLSLVAELELLLLELDLELLLLEELLELLDEVKEFPLQEIHKTAIWLSVLKSIIFKPQGLIAKLEAVPDDDPLTAVGWDDIGVHFPSSTFKTDQDQYEAIDRVWAAIRTKVSVVIVTIPISCPGEDSTATMSPSWMSYSVLMR